MGRIKPLKDDVRSSLRSSVVLFDLTRVVEELLFNSLDAGARKVCVYVGIGTCYVRVEDDGFGITRDGLVLLGDRHATSKVNVINNDEISMKCFGFRGESLASISDASLLEIITKVQGSPNGFRKVIKGCKCMFIGIDDGRQDVGTTVVVRDLFYNQPVRRKQMQSSPKKTLHSIKKCVLRIALVHCAVTFEVVDIESEEKLLHTYASVSPLSIMTNCFGVDICSALHELKFFDGELKISGYVAHSEVIPSATKAFQFIYINSRLICKCPIHKLLNQMFGEFNCSEKSKSNNVGFPVPKIRSQASLVYLLNIYCPYSWYDLMLEPSKASVEFKNWVLILNFIEKAINNFWNKQKNHDDYRNVESSASKGDLIWNENDKVALPDSGLEKDELTELWFKCQNQNSCIGIPSNDAEFLDRRGDMVGRMVNTNTDTGDIELLHPTQDSFKFSHVHPDSFIRTSSKRNLSQLTGRNCSRGQDIFFNKEYMTIRNDDYVDIDSEIGHEYHDGNAFAGSFFDSRRNNNDDLEIYNFFNHSSKVDPTSEGSFSFIEEGFDGERDHFNVKCKSTDFREFEIEYRHTDADNFNIVYNEMYDHPKAKRKRTCLDESKTIYKRVSLDDIIGLEEYGNCDDSFSFSSEAMLREKSNDRLSLIFAGSDITNSNRFHEDLPPSFQFDKDCFTSDHLLSNYSVELDEKLNIAHRRLCKTSPVSSEPQLCGSSTAVNDLMLESGHEHMSRYRSDTCSEYIMEKKHENSFLDNDFSLKSCSKGNYNPAYPDSGKNFNFFEDDNCLFIKDNNLDHIMKRNHSIDMCFDEMDCSVSPRSIGVCNKTTSISSSLHISSYNDDEDCMIRFKHQRHDNNGIPKEKTRRSLSAPPYYRGNKRLPSSVKQCIKYRVDAGTCQHDGGFESKGNEGVVKNSENAERNGRDFLSPSHLPIVKLNPSGESVSHTSKFTKNTKCSSRDSNKEGNDKIQDLSVKWRRGVSHTVNHNKSHLEYGNCDIPSISSENLHVVGDSLIPESIDIKSLEVAKVLQQVDKKFIPVVSGTTLMVIDQHAADERIRVEELRQKVYSGEMRTVSYLDVERELVLPGIGYQMLQNYAEKIKSWGWICNIFSEKSETFSRNLNILHEQQTEIKLIAVPCILGVTLSDVDLLEFLQQLVDTDGSSTIPPAVIRILNSKACRGAIMFGDRLLLSECSLIVEELRHTSLWFQCAHGRPTAVPLVNLRALHNLGEEETRPWHGLCKHPPSLSRALRRLEAADSGASPGY